MTKKHKNKLPLLNFSQQTSSSKVDLLEEKLLALCHKIHQLQCKDMLKKKPQNKGFRGFCSSIATAMAAALPIFELPVAFVTFKSRSAAAVAAQLQQHTHPLLWVTELAPEPRDVSWRNLRVSYRVVPLYSFGVVIAASLLTIFFAIPVTAVQGIAKYEKLKKWFPPAMVVQLIPGLSSIVTGYLLSVVLKGFIYIVPFAMFAMAKVSGYVSRRSLFDTIGKFISHPKVIPSQLATAVSAQADFFVTYILTDGLSGFSLEVLQPGLLIWDALKSCTLGTQREKSPYLYSLPYFRIIPFISLSILIGLYPNPKPMFVFSMGDLLRLILLVGLLQLDRI
ncbi:hypothetical protein TSUD_401410 [Trifolium subterraneum]|uniref:CSC1/OSCA1-like 7TM region domain-containing protein n=1 Tax=Trifolium subterraneum TaxID=3900 RepID=A0A2Z6PAH7_TRISU|nr:hypothetical protein TSUD_401410 [Trifolium subterraneum]